MTLELSIPQKLELMYLKDHKITDITIDFVIDNTSMTVEFEDVDYDWEELENPYSNISSFDIKKVRNFEIGIEDWLLAKVADSVDLQTNLDVSGKLHINLRYDTYDLSMDQYIKKTENYYCEPLFKKKHRNPWKQKLKSN